MSSTDDKRKRKKPRDNKVDRRASQKESKSVKEKEDDAPKVITASFAGNEYSGILKTSHLGARSFEGDAKYTWSSGIKYEGPFTASHIEGRGKFTWPDGSIYEGDISNGKRHGDGVYTGSDGVTKYEGQWVQGKRHGNGRISYDATGEAHYTGNWEDGWKHGDGKQIWPSGNVYEGQWRFGKMAGHGTMTWKDNGSHEVYSGNWEDNQPQGVGTQSWLAQEGRADGFAKEGPSQQMNNRYHGEWKGGVRHGEGAFFYANGATYCGSWNENVKHGQGKYTFDTGKVYNGAFTNDQMKEYADPKESFSRTALNIGAEDNPVRRCVDVSDLEIFALPSDTAATNEAEEGSGYDESHEVMREVHNMLLRYLGELKEEYSRYRKILPRESDDPFVLSSHQIWMLARDFDMLTPSFTLSAFNRCILSGPRQHQETAGDEEVQELRPLTPRKDDAGSEKKDRKTSRMPPSADASVADASMSVDASPVPQSSIQLIPLASQTRKESEDVFSDMTSSCPSTPRSAFPEDAGTYSIEPTCQSEGAAAEETSFDQVSRASHVVSPSSRSMSNARDCSGMQELLHSKFWRKEDATDLVDIHSPARVFLFRHFLEIFVRVAVGRFPNECGLEQQVRRLFKECLAPRFNSERLSESTFGFLQDPDISKVFDGLQHQLWSVFKEHAVGEGSYGAPQWLNPLREEEGLFRLHDEEEKSPVGAAGDAPTGRRRRRGFGGQQRRVHIKARMDVTIRVKDALHLLHGAGLLLPPGATERYPPFATDIHSAVFPDVARLSADLESSMAPIADLGGLKGLLEPGTPQGSGDPPQALPEANGQVRASEQPIRQESECSSTHQKSESPQQALPAKTEAATNGVDAKDSDEVVEVSDRSFRLTIVEVLKLLCEVSAPESATKLCWAVRGEEVAKKECVGVLDFLETELNFSEFKRLLLRVSQQKTQSSEAADVKQPAEHKRLDKFLRQIFLPSLEEREPSSSSQEAPPAEDQQPAAGFVTDPDTVVETSTTDPPAVDAAVAEEADQPDAKPPSSANEARPFQLWHGFDEGDLNCLEVDAVPRVWPEDYELEISNW